MCLVMSDVTYACTCGLNPGFPQPDESVLLIPVGENKSVMEPTLPTTPGGVQHSIQSLTQVVDMHQLLFVERRLCFWVCFVFAESRFLLIWIQN